MVINWKTVPLGEVIAFQRGFDLPNRVRKSGAIPIVSSAGVTGYHDVAIVAEPGVVTGRYGTIGELFFLKEPFWPLNTTLYVRDFFGNDEKFIYYLLQRFDFDAFSGKSGVPGVNRNDLHNEPVNLPTCVSEQRAIATALSDMDALLDGLDRLIAKKRAIKQATMQQLLTGQTRLPGFSGEWLRAELRTLVSIPITDGPHMTPDFHESGIPFLSVNNLVDNRIYLADLRYISKTDDEVFSRKCKPKKYDVLLGKAASVGKVAIVEDDFDFNIWSPIALIRPNSSVSAKFIYYQLLSGNCISQIMLLTNSSSQGNIGMGDIERIEISHPSIAEQAAIATILSDMDAEIATLETRRTKTRFLKQAMMQELLTGRTRLVELDAKPVEKEVVQTEGRKTNVYFLRSVLAAEIIDQLHDQPTFGHVKFEKMMFLVEHLCDVDTGSTYHRKAAGPYDNRALRSIDSQLQKQQWFEARKQEGRYQYVPLAKRGGHKPYFDRYFPGITEPLEKILSTFKTARTEQCEIVATLLAAWNDLLREKGAVSDEVIVHEVLNNWHESKQRIPEDRWLKALGWMREKGFVPKGVIPI